MKFCPRTPFLISPWAFCQEKKKDKMAQNGFYLATDIALDMPGSGLPSRQDVIFQTKSFEVIINAELFRRH